MKQKELIGLITAKYAGLCRLHPTQVSPETVVREELRVKLVAEISQLPGCKIANRPEFVTIADFAELVIRTRYKRLVGLKLLQMSRDVFGIYPDGDDNLPKQV